MFFLGRIPRILSGFFFTASLILTLCLSLDCFAAYKVFPFFFIPFVLLLPQAFVGARTVNASRKSWFLRSACTLLPEPYRKLLSLDSFALHVLLYCVLTYNRRGNSYMYRWLARSADACLTANRKNTWTDWASAQTSLSFLGKPHIYNLHVLDASVCKWLMQCYASLTAEVCLESENLLRSYHSRPPSLPLISKTQRWAHKWARGIYFDFIKRMETVAKHKP